MKRHVRDLPLLAGLALLLSAAGCGDDGDSGPPPPPPRAQPAQATAGGAPGAQIRGYTKIESIVSEEEAREIRHRFRPDDFRPDLSGNLRRDPFLSYVVRQGAVGEQDQAATDDFCRRKAEATNYQVSDLRLAGIVLRGTRSYAVFLDRASFGHIVQLGSCIGKEKARVEKIGTDYVETVEIPEAAPNAPAAPPRTRVFLLHPEALPLEDEPAQETTD
jgi:Tfp pilus assembly protein PilP